MRIRNKEIKSKGYTGMPNVILRAGKKLTHIQYRILMTLCDYTDGYGFNESSLARRCGMDRSTIRRNIKPLKELGWIVELGDQYILKSVAENNTSNCGTEQHPTVAQSNTTCGTEQHRTNKELLDKEITDKELLAKSPTKEGETICLGTPYHFNKLNNNEANTD